MSTMRTAVRARRGMSNVLLILEKNGEKGRALSRAMDHARRLAAVFWPMITKY